MREKPGLARNRTRKSFVPAAPAAKPTAAGTDTQAAANKSSFSASCFTVSHWVCWDTLPPEARKIKGLFGK